MSDIKTSFQDMLNILQLAVLANGFGSLAPTSPEGEKPHATAPHQHSSIIFTGKSPFEDCPHTCEPAHPEINAMEIAKVAIEEVEATKQVFKTTNEFKRLQLQELKAAKDK
ncbi:hypothetical protein Tco_0710798 [Tanacetum coccineum]